MALKDIEPGAKSLNFTEHNRLISQTRTNTNLDLDSRFFAKSRNLIRLSYQFIPENLPSQRFPAHITAWNSGTTNYDWFEVERNSADNAFEEKTGGRNQDDYANARHYSLWENLPCTTGNPILVTMSLDKDADGDHTPFFDVPIQRDGTFAHRTTAAGTPTLGNRVDRSKTEAEIKQATGTFAPSTEYGIEAQTSGKQGWVETYQTGAGYDTTAHDFVIQFWDVEFDVMGRSISRSKTFETQLIDLEAC